MPATDSRLPAPEGAWDRPAWYDDAACKGTDPALFYPTEKGDNCTEAKALCAVCPVRVPCLIAGQQERFGIWGGQVAGRSPMAVRHRRQARLRGVA